MERRAFLGWAGVGVLASCLPVAIAACSSPQTPNNRETSDSQDPNEDVAVTPNGEGFLAVGSVDQLKQDGYLVNKAAKVMVVQGENNNLSALNPTCTHQQCTVEWRQSSSSLYCPCHGSEFATDGTVIQGPAEQPLSSYAVQEEGSSVLVKVS